MPRWIVERGIGETRAALVDGDTILEACIEPDDGLRAGTVLAARLVKRLPQRNEGIVAWDGGEAMLAPLPRALPEGGTLLVEITRPSLPEPGKPKRARARPAADGAVPGNGPDLLARLPDATLLGRFHADLLEAVGWSMLLEEAVTGQVTFAQGALTLSLTPAMTLIDVDGELAPATLAVAGAAAAARAVRRLDMGGSIGIDLPDAGDKGARQAAAAAIDAALPQPFERTAVNGFGFVQIVRRRARVSIPELYAHDPVAAHARALLRRAERTGGAGERTLTAHPALVAWLADRPGWLAELEQRVGAPVALRAEPGLAISAGHVQARFP
ncbi:ribonuclease [Sphingomonas sp. ac-8]|uniref:ribonuclease n=1 Tax=Sphingomonas sp. ac-8 TaxID=3242977 RepID=UPI003A800F99